jgi:hypothetical protein
VIFFLPGGAVAAQEREQIAAAEFGAGGFALRVIALE